MHLRSQTQELIGPSSEPELYDKNAQQNSLKLKLSEAWTKENKNLIKPTWLK